MRRRFIAQPVAALASLALASVALAGGWAQVTVDSPPVDPPAGGETTIEMRVLQHGVTPVSWPALTVVATDATSGAVVQSAARANGPVGIYVATMILPSAGEWTLTFDSAELDMAGSLSLNVAPAVATVQTAVAAPAAATFDFVPLMLALFAAALALAIAGLVLRSRGRTRDTRVSAST